MSRGEPWVLFAGLLILMAGAWNLFQACVALFRSTFLIGDPVFGATWEWGALWAVIGVLEVLAGVGLLRGRSWGRWLGLVVVGCSALASDVTIEMYPLWVLTILALDVVIINALIVGWPAVRTPRQAG